GSAGPGGTRPAGAGDGGGRAYGGPPLVAGPGLEALRLLVHRPEEIGPRLRPVFFDGDLAARAFQARDAAANLHDAVAAADPDVADLLQRLAETGPGRGANGSNGPGRHGLLGSLAGIPIRSRGERR